MVYWKTSTGLIYIQNQDLYNFVCEINSQSYSIVEKKRWEVPVLEKTWRGLYKNINIGFIGVFASSIGPILFINQDTYPLIRSDFDIEFIRKGKGLIKREFIFYYKGNEVYRTEYTQEESYYIDPYDEDESFSDFFLWLYENKDDEKFYKYYKYSEVDRDA